MIRSIYLLFIVFLSIGFVSDNVDNIEGDKKIKGVCWVAQDSIVLSNFQSLVDNNVEWISQTPFLYQRGIDNPNIRWDNSNYNWGEQDKGLIETSLLAKTLGIKTILKPHIWISRANGKWRSDLAMKNEIDWDIWFDIYKEAMMHYAVVASKGKMEALCIGTELYIPATKFPEKWRDIICEVRKLYSGQITYAANFYKEYKEIEFWDDLDFIGIQAYFPIAKNKNPEVKALVQSWKSHKRSMEKLSKKYDKKIVFTEVGYKNTADAAIEPWLWPRQMKDDVEVSETTQVNCYKAMFEANWNEDWFGGLFIWKWFHGSHQFSYEEYQERRRKRRAARGYKETASHGVRFTPQNGEAETIMKNWFAKR